MKKLVSLLCTAALTAGLLAGCSGGTSSTPAPEGSAAPETTPAETSSLGGATL